MLDSLARRSAKQNSIRKRESFVDRAIPSAYAGNDTIVAQGRAAIRMHSLIQIKCRVTSYLRGSRFALCAYSKAITYLGCAHYRPIESKHYERLN